MKSDVEPRLSGRHTWRRKLSCQIAQVRGSAHHTAVEPLAGDVKTRLTVAMRRSVVMGVLVLGWVTRADAEPVLHEYCDFGGRTLPVMNSGRGSNAANTEGRVSDALAHTNPRAGSGADGEGAVPDPAEANGAVIPSGAAEEPPQRGAATAKKGAEGDTGRYRLDGNTSTPSVVGYSDPFSPSIPPFKRLFAYDSVNPNLELVVARETLTPVGVGGAARGSDDQFFAEVKVDAASDRPARLPTVGAGFRILSSKVSPERQFSLLQDSAENLFVKGLPAGSVTWTAHWRLIGVCLDPRSRGALVDTQTLFARTSGRRCHRCWRRCWPKLGSRLPNVQLKRCGAWCSTFGALVRRKNSTRRPAYSCTTTSPCRSKVCVDTARLRSW